jgi:hypothetical protein
MAKLRKKEVRTPAPPVLALRALPELDESGSPTRSILLTPALAAELEARRKALREKELRELREKERARRFKQRRDDRNRERQATAAYQKELALTEAHRLIKGNSLFLNRRKLYPAVRAALLKHEVKVDPRTVRRYLQDDPFS